MTDPTHIPLDPQGNNWTARSERAERAADAALEAYRRSGHMTLRDALVHAARAYVAIDHFATTPAAPAPDGLRPEVLAFARLMEAKLRKHDVRMGQSWKDDDPEALFLRLKQEGQELWWALGGDGDVVGEAVDVANFAMMIADISGLVYPADHHRAAREGRADV